jgi:hypothetical protein
MVVLQRERSAAGDDDLLAAVVEDDALDVGLTVDRLFVRCDVTDVSHRPVTTLAGGGISELSDAAFASDVAFGSVDAIAVAVAVAVAVDRLQRVYVVDATRGAILRGGPGGELEALLTEATLPATAGGVPRDLAPLDGLGALVISATGDVIFSNRLVLWRLVGAADAT